jgi:hypothetical protein
MIIFRARSVRVDDSIYHSREWTDDNGRKYGELHREDGPAIERDNGIKEWWYQGQYIRVTTQDEFEKLMKMKAFW